MATWPARALFEEAERLLAESDGESAILYPYAGFHYCELLLALGDVDEALRRAKLALAIAEHYGRLLDIAKDHLSLGRAVLSDKVNDSRASAHINKAVDGIRDAGRWDELPGSLLTRARLRRLQTDFRGAWRDLREAEKIVHRLELRLDRADLTLERARLYHAEHRLGEARAELARARQLVDAMKYGFLRPGIEKLAAELGTDMAGGATV